MKASNFREVHGEAVRRVRAGLDLCGAARRRWVRLGCLAAALAMAAAPVRAESDSAVWHGTGGAQIKGRLTEVFGSMVLIKGKERTALLPMATLTDAELQRVADFLATEGSTPAWKESKSKVAKDLIGRLDIVRDGKVVAYDPAARPEPALYLIYFSAGWCGPCHRFTPELVKAYERFQEKVPGRIEVIFVSWDRSDREQANYAREAGMPWPMLGYRHGGSARSVERWAGNGIPCLVALTRSGDAVAHSYRGEEYLGPGQVLEACEQLLPLLAGDTPAVRRGRHRLAVLQHIAAAGGGDRPPKPYLMGFDPVKLGAIGIPDMMLSLDLDEQGKVREMRVEDGVSHDLERLVAGQAEQWLFLPAVQQGRACAMTVRMPLAMKARRTAEVSGAGS